QVEHLAESRLKVWREAFAVDLVDQVEQGGQRSGGVEVVSERVEERFPVRGDRGVTVWGNACPSSQAAEVRDPLDRASGVLDQLVGVAERLAVVAPQEVHDD